MCSGECFGGLGSDGGLSYLGEQCAEFVQLVGDGCKFVIGYVAVEGDFQQHGDRARVIGKLLHECSPHAFFVGVECCVQIGLELLDSGLNDGFCGLGECVVFGARADGTGQQG